MVGDGDEKILERMLRRLVPRGPDEEGRHLEPGVMLGVRRLQVIDPEGGHQPMGNETCPERGRGTGTVWVALNGEIYNYRELRAELISKGHRFTTHCDTEVLVHLYEQEGEEGVHRLRGMFAYALWDRARDTLFLFRDRLGIKPLYYALSSGGNSGTGALMFASELPALVAGMSPPSLRPEAIAQYLTRLYVPGTGTIFQGIQEVRAGEWVQIRQGRLETRRYFRLDKAWREQPEVRVQDLAERFLESLKDTVRHHLVSDVPLGLFLSGGLDSGAILAMMRTLSDQPIKTFSIGYEAQADRSYNELEAARLLADHFGTVHTEERLRPDAVTLLPRIVAAMGEPFADSSAIPTYLVSQVARRSVTVALSGIGGDELFGGYPRYLGIRTAARYAVVPRGLRAWTAATLSPWLSEGAGSQNYAGRLRRFLRDGHRSLAEQYTRWMTFLPPEREGEIFTPGLYPYAQNAMLDRTYPDLFQIWPSEDPSDRAMALDLQTYLPDDLLRMGDRLSMAHSLELRVPFCDHELLALALAVPARVRFQGWKLKGFMRRALKALLPQTILDRSKFGFQVPVARWLREDLREMVHDLLSEDTIRRRGYVRPEYVQWLIREHEDGRRNFADQLYALLVLELWHQTRES